MTQGLAVKLAAICKILSVNIEKQLSPVAGDVPQIIRCLINLAARRATPAFGAGLGEEFNGEAIIAVLKDGSKGGQKPFCAVIARTRILNMIRIFTVCCFGVLSRRGVCHVDHLCQVSGRAGQ